MPGRATLDTDTAQPRVLRVNVTTSVLHVELSDGRSLDVPLRWYPRLLHASASERRQWRLVGHGVGVHWACLDEDISVEALLAGRASGESKVSLERWLASRSQHHRVPPGTGDASKHGRA